MGKKNKSNLGVVVILLLIVMVFIGGIAWWVVKEINKPQQPLDQQQQNVNVNVNRTGEDAKLLINAYARMLNTQTQTNTSVYCKRNGESGLIADGLILSTAQRTEIPVSIGDKIDCISFDNIYYGAWKSIEIKGKSENLDLDNWNISKRLGGVVIKTYNIGNSVAGSGNLSVNVSMVGNQTGRFGRIIIEMNETDASFNLGGITIDTDANSTIKDSRLQNGRFNGNIYTDNEAIALSRLSGQSDYRFEFDSNPGTPEKEAIFLEENDEVEFGALEFDANAVGCVSMENMIIIAWDKNYYRSLREQTVKGPAGQSDANIPSNIGAPDVYVRQLCVSG